MLRRHRQIRTRIHQVLDIGLFVLALWLAHLWRAHWKIQILGGDPEIRSFDNFVWLYFIIIPLTPLLLHVEGFYNRPIIASRRQTSWALFKTCALMTLGVVAAIFMFRAQYLTARSVIFLFGLLSFVLVFLKEEAVRWLAQSKVGNLHLQKRVILAGTTEDTSRLRAQLRDSAQDGIEIVLEVDLNNMPIEDLVHYLHEHSINCVLLNAKHTYFGLVEKAIQACELEGVEAWLVADFFNTQISRTSLDHFYGRPVLVFHSGPEASWQAVIKKFIDIVGASFLLVLTAPMFVIAMLAIRLSSPGPIFFRQLRSGVNGRPFTMFKFRSMVTNAEQMQDELASMNEMSGPVFKVTSDPRITPVGRTLRKLSVDELPQLINILRGEMSLVGPRPLPVDEVNRFNDLAHRRRLSVKPGLTCLWQISGRNQINDFRDWVRLDLEYIDNWSLWLDFKILCRTIPVVLMAKGAR